ncbi:MAG: DUF4214 domain-containing protein [Acidimicrobiales bacterium]
MQRHLLAILAVLTAAIGLTIAPPPAGAATTGDPGWYSTPDVIWDVTNPATTSQHTNDLRTIVRDMEEFEGRMYVAGKFLDVVAPDGTTHAQPYLAAFDLDTGVWDSTFRPVLDGIVYSIEITPDGRLYVGGEFAGGSALYDARTGARNTTYQPGITLSWGPPAVFDVEVVGSSVYLGGRFSSAQGTTLSNLARVDATTGVLDTGWTPMANPDVSVSAEAGQLVHALAIDSTRQRVYVAGKFGGINGNTDAAYFAILTTTDGSFVPGLPQGLPLGIPDHREVASMTMEDVQFEGDRVYLGGSAHQTMLLDAADLSVDATFHTNQGVGDIAAGGDTQVITIGKHTIWSGCHCWGSVGPYEIGSYAAGRMTYAEYLQWTYDFGTKNPFGQQRVRGGFGIDKTTEELIPLTIDVTGQAGAYAIVEDSLGRVWFGGQFSNVASTGRAVSGMIRLSPTVPPVVPADDARPADDQIVRLYRAVFGRSPDAAGFLYWTAVYRGGRPLARIADDFMTSAEWQQRFGNQLDDAALVDQLYRNVLGRPGEPEGVAYWIGQLAGGVTRNATLLAFVDSPENIAITGTSAPIAADEARVLRLYRAAFGRAPDDEGYEYWVGLHRGGASLEALATEFVASAEWATRFGSNPTPEQLVDALYRNILDRPGDTAGVTYWVAELQRRNVVSVLVAFANSPENLQRTGTVL